MARRMHDNEWLPQAQRKLSGGRKSARGDHDCGEGGSLMLTRDGSALSAYCFRCGSTGMHRERETPAERFARMQAEAEATAFVRRSVLPPEPTSYDPADWPEELATWFYKMGIHHPRMKELGLYYSAEARRVILPIKENGEVVFWMGRTQRFGKGVPKWLGPDVKKRGLFAKYGEGKGAYVCLTEDALSAYKIGMVCEAWSLLGTKLHARHATQLMRLGKPVVVWLDDDHDHYSGVNQGQVAAKAIVDELKAYGLTVYNMTSPNDPKTYSRYELKEMLCSLPCTTSTKPVSSSSP
ncbi:DNA helicase [Stenotrophomonas phage vB_SmeS_BUCT700]|uniref:DNA helicase n=1 Tax=Stenotrophomonas phage vB_SmeS_BUCT700 TaxID=2924895 RepID=A0AAE9K7C0_9CAUD|nr:DNA helicase [Stenotrophomonas phage vB_SmeS_BUCT700]UNY50296.1 DNA primase/helicase [Stenotrophomonas phage vB_SmeS_BUCT703]